MLPNERRDSGQNDFLRARLDQIADLNHALAKLARQVDWGFLEQRFGAAYADVPGRPPLPTRLMAGLAILKLLGLICVSAHDRDRRCPRRFAPNGAIPMTE